MNPFLGRIRTRVRARALRAVAIALALARRRLGAREHKKVLNRVPASYAEKSKLARPDPVGAYGTRILAPHKVSATRQRQWV